MRDSTIARNYAEALLMLARKAGDLDGFGAAIAGIAQGVEHDARLRNFLAAPQVAAVDKKRVVEKALMGAVPRAVVRFLQKLVDNRRQNLIPAIAVEYASLVDAVAGRVHAQVTVARATSDAERDAIAAQLSRVLAKTVVPHVALNPAILGGVIIRIGDQVMDGSVRRRLATLKGKLLAR